MARTQRISPFYLHTVLPANGMTIPAFPAEVGTHSPTAEGWKAKLASERCTSSIMLGLSTGILLQASYQGK